MSAETNFTDTASELKVSPYIGNEFARSLGRTTMIDRSFYGGPVSVQSKQIEKLMQENTQRHANKQAAPDGLEIPIVFND